MCGALLHGTLQKSGTHTNKFAGLPANRDGQVIADASAQPPFLLRYSPALFAAEAPAWFEHDAETNRLSLRPGVAKPWMRQASTSFQTDDPRCWLYCGDCKERYFPDRGARAAATHIPYRDRATINFLKPVLKRRLPSDPRVGTTHKGRGQPPREQQQAQPAEAPIAACRRHVKRASCSGAKLATAIGSVQ